jgi:hypothetical protein
MLGTSSLSLLVVAQESIWDGRQLEKSCGKLDDDAGLRKGNQQSGRGDSSPQTYCDCDDEES